MEPAREARDVTNPAIPTSPLAPNRAADLPLASHEIYDSSLAPTLSCLVQNTSDMPPQESAPSPQLILPCLHQRQEAILGSAGGLFG